MADFHDATLDLFKKVSEWGPGPQHYRCAGYVKHPFIFLGEAVDLAFLSISRCNYMYVI